jgi:hypothetical protein
MHHHPFRIAVEARDHEAVLATLHHDVVLHSPIAFEPFRSKAVVGRLLGVLLEHVFEDFAYTDELAAEGGAHALIFASRVGDKQVQGLDLLRHGDDGRILDFTVMVRPLSAAMALRDAIGPYYQEIVGAE